MGLVNWAAYFRCGFPQRSVVIIRNASTVLFRNASVVLFRNSRCCGFPQRLAVAVHDGVNKSIPRFSAVNFQPSGGNKFASPSA